jgi:predicted dehydrogenase
MKRSTFIRQSSTLAAGITILPFPIFGKNAPSNKVVLAVKGVNSRGAYLAESFIKLNNVEVAYLCDVEDSAIANGLKPFSQAAKQPEIVRDVRQLVAKPDFDALVIASPDHWHAPATLLAVQHGKHVFVEKPCSHNPYEGELLVRAMKKYPKLVIEMGNQRRSFPNLIEAVKQVKEGLIGNAYHGKGWYANNRKSIGKGKTVPVPPNLDFELWQGPAPRKQYRDNLVHYNWHWFWHWGTAETCNNGTHEIDCCRWFLDVNYPVKVSSAGGRYAFKDDWEMPDTQTAGFEFGEGKSITWEGRSCNKFPMEGAGRGFIIFGDKGTLVNKGNDDYEVYDTENNLLKQVKSPTVPNDPTNPVSASGNLDLYHFQNFIDSIRGNAVNTSPMDEAHKSILLCHLANIAHRTGHTLHCNPSNGHILKDEKAMGLWKREYEKSWASLMR